MNFLLGLLVLLAPSFSAAEAPIVIFAQIGHSVTLPRIKWGSKQEVIHVNWNFKDEFLISRNPTSSSPKLVPQNWQGRLTLSPDYSLIISPVHESDFDIFTCEQHELVNEHKTTYKLYHVTMSTPSPLLAGDSLSLSCETENTGFSLKQHSIKWFGPEGASYSGNSNRNRYTLRVNNVSSIHNGKWICEIKYGQDKTSNAMANVIIVDLAPSPPDPIYTFDSSSNFPIPCFLASKIPWSIVNATGVNGGSWSFTPLDLSQSPLTLLKLEPNPSPSWTFVDRTQRSLLETDLKGHELNVKISRVSIKDRGTYKCSLEFKLRTLSRIVKVEVLQVVSSAGKAVVHEGNAVNLTCTLGHPMAFDLEVNWIPPPSSPLKNLSPPHPIQLSIPEVRIKDSGRWTCQLKKNATVLTSATVSLKVEKVPVNIWLIVAIVGGVLVFILLAVITVVIIRRQKQTVSYRRRRKRFCRCKNPQKKGFYKT